MLLIVNFSRHHPCALLNEQFDVTELCSLVTANITRESGSTSTYLVTLWFQDVGGFIGKIFKRSVFVSLSTA